MTRGNTGRNWNGNDQTEEVVSTAEVELFENGIVKLVWTVDDVANELKCSVRHIRKLVSEDRIPFFKVGRLVRFSPLRLREWLQKGGTR
jgi:excisionase family DNA binding protein